MGAVFGALLVPSFVALGAPSVALPSIARGLGVPFGALSWVLASWALCSAVAMPLFGRLSRRVGLRASLIVGVVLVAVGSITAALSPGLGVLIAGRSVGGAGAGALIISSYATVNARFDGAARGRALAVVAAVVTTGSGCGTLIGGLLTAWPGWRMVLAVPALAVLMAWPAARLAPADRSPTARIGVGGAVLVTVVGGAMVGLLQAPATHLPFLVAAGLALVAAVAAGLLIGHVRREPNGFVPRRIITAPYFVLAGVAGLTIFAAYYATLFAAPALIEAATGWKAPLVGAVLLPCAAFSVLGARGAAARSGRYSITRSVVTIGVVSTAGVLLAALLPGVPAVSVLGLALTAASFAAAQTVLFGLVPALVARADQDSALGLFNFLVYGGSSVGPAAVGGLSAGLPLSDALAVAAALPLLGLGAVLLGRHHAPTRPT